MTSGTSDKTESIRPAVEDISALTDVYFNKTRAAVEKFGDVHVTYGVFMRRTVVCAPRLAVDWLHAVAAARDTMFDIELCVAESHIVEADQPMLYISGSFADLVDLETLLLQKLGAACVAAYNASQMCIALPNVAFMAFDARHCAGTDMAEMLAETFPGEAMTVLVDYFSHEISDSLAVAARFPELAEAGKLSLRLDTPGGIFSEGLDAAVSRSILERCAPAVLDRDLSAAELGYLIGDGVSAAAIWQLRERLDAAGFSAVKIVASSGFGPAKCAAMAAANAPLDAIGTGSFLPETWSETYATADIVAYDGTPRVKVGREFLLRK